MEVRWSWFADFVAMSLEAGAPPAQSRFGNQMAMRFAAAVAAANHAALARREAPAMGPAASHRCRAPCATTARLFLLQGSHAGAYASNVPRGWTKFPGRNMSTGRTRVLISVRRQEEASGQVWFRGWRRSPCGGMKLRRRPGAWLGEGSRTLLPTAPALRGRVGFTRK